MQQTPAGSGTVYTGFVDPGSECDKVAASLGNRRAAYPDELTNIRRDDTFKHAAGIFRPLVH